MKLNPKANKALEIVNRLKQAGFTAYWVGGCVRDMLLGKQPHDYDIATNATPDLVEQLFEKTIPVGKQFGVMLVVVDGDSFQVATFRSETDYKDGRHPQRVAFCDPAEDARRRDFTINGLFYDPLKNEVIDYVNGKMDIERRLIRAIGCPDERFNEDYLRMLRAVRFAAQLGFEIEAATFAAIQKNAEKIKLISPERIRDELLKLFLPPHAARGLELLNQSRLLKEILPEVADMIGVEQSPEYHPEGCVYTHTLKVLENLPPDADDILAWSALLHDVGKPHVAARSKCDDRRLFYEHDVVGAQMAQAILERLKFPSDKIEAIVACVRHHMQLKDAPKMKKSTLRRMLARPTINIEIELHRLDCLASQRGLEIYNFLKQKQQEYPEEKALPPPLITGEDLKKLGFSQGVKLGRVLKEIREKQLQDEITTPEQAIEYARNILDKE
ncbi:MAG: CCA tRNA nucleotidyltransferase [Verrucomicrobiia bacterium]|jgi:poly(A) polymerase